MKIKIKKSSSVLYWYKKLIGETLTVHAVEADGYEIYVGSLTSEQHKKIQLSSSVIGVVDLEDAEIVKDIRYFVKRSHVGFIQMLYRLKPEQFNDGSIRECLQYRSSFDIWMGTNGPKDEVLAGLEEITEVEFRELASI